jgi:hypothetical protein
MLSLIKVIILIIKVKNQEILNDVCEKCESQSEIRKTLYNNQTNAKMENGLTKKPFMNCHKLKCSFRFWQLNTSAK